MLRVLVSSLLLGLASSAAAQEIRFDVQTRVLDVQGDPVQGDLSVIVALYTAPTGGTPIWDDTVPAVAEDGYISVELGADPSLPVGLFQQDLYAAVSLGSLDPNQSRQRLRAVPYAAVSHGIRTVSSTPDASECTGNEGAIVFDTVAGALHVCDGTAWVEVTGGDAAPPPFDTDLLRTVYVGTDRYDITLSQGYSESCDTACSRAGLSCSETKLDSLHAEITQSSTRFGTFLTDDLDLSFSTGSINPNVSSSSVPYMGLGCGSNDWRFTGFDNSPIISGCSNNTVNISTTPMQCSTGFYCGGFCGVKICTCE